MSVDINAHAVFGWRVKPTPEMEEHLEEIGGGCICEDDLPEGFTTVDCPYSGDQVFFYLGGAGVHRHVGERDAVYPLVHSYMEGKQCDLPEGWAHSGKSGYAMHLMARYR